jgi:hypothetical protein
MDIEKGTSPGAAAATATANLPGFIPPQESSSAKAAAPATSDRPKERVQRKRVNIPIGTGAYWVAEVIMALGALISGLLLWWADGYFTIAFVSTLFPTFDQLGLWCWAVPVVFTAWTFGAWPRKELRAKVARLRSSYEASEHDEDYLAYAALRREIRIRWGLVVFVVLVNVGTSFAGLVTFLKGRTINLFMGFTIPETGWGLFLPALIIGVILAFGPEKIVKIAFPHLMKLLQR